MDEEKGFSVRYKNLIDGNLAPEPARTAAALRAILRRLPERAPPEIITVDSSEQL